MPMNTPLDVARYIIQASADQKAHGKALYVAGGNAVDIEEGIWKLEPQWLGEKNSRDLREGQIIMGVVSSSHTCPTIPSATGLDSLSKEDTHINE